MEDHAKMSLNYMSEFEVQLLAYLRRTVDALEHISLVLSVLNSQSQHPSIGGQIVPKPMTEDIDVLHRPGFRVFDQTNKK